MSKAWIEDLWLTEPRETLPDGSKVKIPVPQFCNEELGRVYEDAGEGQGAREV